MGGMTADWLAQLAPPHAPPPPGWWPLAPGWWMLLILFVALAAAGIYRQCKPAVRLRRLALRELKDLQANTTDDSVLASELENLLRRYALARYGRDTVANLSGERWIAFVVAHGGVALSGANGSNLLRMAYGGAATADRNAWLSGSRAFIRGRA